MTSVVPAAVPGVIASEAKQSRLHDVSLDCFASLAMTALKRQPSYKTRVWLRPSAALC